MTIDNLFKGIKSSDFMKNLFHFMDLFYGDASFTVKDSVILKFVGVKNNAIIFRSQYSGKEIYVISGNNVKYDLDGILFTEDDIIIGLYDSLLIKEVFHTAKIMEKSSYTIKHIL